MLVPIEIEVTEKDAKRIEALKNAMNASAHRHDVDRPVRIQSLTASLALYSLDECEAIYRLKQQKVG